MGKITAGILGGFSGKVGNVVGGSWKGISTMRIMPASVANPRTTGQVNQRNKFSGVVDLAQSFLVNTIKPLNDRFAVKQSGYNLFVSRNIELFADNGSFQPDSAIKFGQGELGETQVTYAGAGTGKDFRLTWPTSVSGKQLSTDEAYICIIKGSADERAWYPTAATRADGAYEGDFFNGVDADSCFFLTFRSADGTKVGTTTRDSNIA